MTTWVLLRGLMRETRHWGDFPPRLAAALGGAQVVAIDLPGNGRANALPSPTRVEATVDYARRELAARGCTPPYVPVALSLGGMVAACWAARHDGELAGGVLINTSLRPFSPFYRRLRPARYPILARLALCGGDGARWENAIFDITSRRPALRDACLGAWIAWRGEHPVSRRNALCQLVAAARYAAPLTAPACALLVLASGGDALVDPACSRTLAARWNTAYAEHPDAGHDLPLDDSAWVVEEIVKWSRAAGVPRATGTAGIRRDDGGR
ncbi:MAG: alpha/beta hydrolase [Gammaproteobacteria bacterium]|nr:alpha/beta hydrolase [Gammaproteobacteria bacterium]